MKYIVIVFLIGAGFIGILTIKAIVAAAAWMDNSFRWGGKNG